MQFQSFHTPPANIGKQWVFLPNGITQYIGEPWKKPKWASMVSLLIIQPGGGGGGGHSRAANGNGTGGGGGASGAIARLIIPAICLPDTLYAFVPPGGQGGAAATIGTAGLLTIVNFGRTDAAPNWLLHASGGNANAGAAGNAVSAAGGTAPTASSAQPFSLFGIFSASNGIAGGNAGTNTGGAAGDITAWAANPLSGGAGGGSSGTTGPGTDFAGGNQIATALTDFGSQGYFPITGSGKIAAGGAANGGHGSAGAKNITPMLNSGGAGGGSDNDGTGGTGGEGGYGCGGGGGGAGVTGGKGGNGGPGLIIINAW